MIKIEKKCKISDHDLLNDYGYQVTMILDSVIFPTNLSSGLIVYSTLVQIKGLVLRIYDI